MREESEKRSIAYPVRTIYTSGISVCVHEYEREARGLEFRPIKI